MTEYIQRDAVLSCFHDWIDRQGNVYTPDEMAEYRAIEELPAADVVPASDFRDCRNELCLKCEAYTQKHNGACDGCRWR